MCFLDLPGGFTGAQFGRDRIARHQRLDVAQPGDDPVEHCAVGLAVQGELALDARTAQHHRVLGHAKVHARLAGFGRDPEVRRLHRRKELVLKPDPLRRIAGRPERCLAHRMCARTLPGKGCLARLRGAGPDPGDRPPSRQGLAVSRCVYPNLASPCMHKWPCSFAAHSVQTSPSASAFGAALTVNGAISNSGATAR